MTEFNKIHVKADESGKHVSLNGKSISNLIYEIQVTVGADSVPWVCISLAANLELMVNGRVKLDPEATNLLIEAGWIPPPWSEL